MASDIIINGSTYNGNPASGTLWRPTAIETRTIKIGTSVVAESGARTFVQRATKYEWRIRWEKVNEATRLAVAIVAALATTFTFVDAGGTSYTVQTEADDHSQETAFTDRSNSIYYNLGLTLREV